MPPCWVYSGDSDPAVAVTRLCYSAPAVGQCNRYIALPSLDNVTQRYLQVFANCAIAPLMKPRLPPPH
ncbi:hypothetical protein [Nostoc sp.]|uniref:hypothetical protein n=1 Tax=Nostoc sp. TaxID=1180 RepID=UPI002FFC85D8